MNSYVRSKWGVWCEMQKNEKSGQGQEVEVNGCHG